VKTISKRKVQKRFREDTEALHGIIRELLYDEKPEPVLPRRLTEAELLDKLNKGEGIYWDLQRGDNGQIERVLPYSREKVIAKLVKLAQA
jgi:hypothetical protein